MYSDGWPTARLSVCSATEAESIKLFVNTFYAVKVQVFNEFYALCMSQGTDFAVIRDLMLGNGWIHPMHTRVPGPDGMLRFGGACLPKDSRACLHLMKRRSTPCAVIEATVAENPQRKPE